ncbi:MAG: hypothetical protein U0903_22460 [Planctomycetales bacterium]
MHVAIVTAGGAGMYCGSCMQDNTWAGALLKTGTAVTLIPTYTPLKLDEENHAIKPVFLGGLNLYLDYRYGWWRKIPRLFTRWLDARWVINLATRFRVSNDATELGELTVALLQGADGPQRRQVEEFVDYLTTELRPDIICFSNALLSGVLPLLRSRFTGPILCTLQGDDIFLDGLIEPYKSQSLSRLRENVKHSTGFSPMCRLLSRYDVQTPPGPRRNVPRGTFVARLHRPLRPSPAAAMTSTSLSVTSPASAPKRDCMFSSTLSLTSLTGNTLRRN